jgi:hypothetical protein
MRNLQSRIESESNNAGFSTILRGDIVDSGSLPTLMMQLAIASMYKVVKAANKIAEQERQSTIANFIMAFMMFIPMAGATAHLLGSTVLLTILNDASELANISLAIYKVVENPDNALLNVFGLLLRGVSLKPFKDVAQARQSMKSRDCDKLVPSKKDLGRIDTLKGRTLSCEKN